MLWIVLFPHWSDCSEGPGRFSSAARLPLHHIHPGRHQKRAAQTRHPARAGDAQQRYHSQSAVYFWPSSRQLSSLPSRNTPYSPALWCGAVLSPIGDCSRGVPGRKWCVTCSLLQLRTHLVLQQSYNHIILQYMIFVVFDWALNKGILLKWFHSLRFRGTTKNVANQLVSQWEATRWPLGVCHSSTSTPAWSESSVPEDKTGKQHQVREATQSDSVGMADCTACLV